MIIVLAPAKVGTGFRNKCKDHIVLAPAKVGTGLRNKCKDHIVLAPAKVGAGLRNKCKDHKRKLILKNSDFECFEYKKIKIIFL